MTDTILDIFYTVPTFALKILTNIAEIYEGGN